MMTLPLPNHRHATATMIHHQRAHSVRALWKERARQTWKDKPPKKHIWLIYCFSIWHLESVLFERHNQIAFLGFIVFGGRKSKERMERRKKNCRSVCQNIWITLTDWESCNLHTEWFSERFNCNAKQVHSMRVDRH